MEIRFRCKGGRPVRMCDERLEHSNNASRPVGVGHAYNSRDVCLPQEAQVPSGSFLVAHSRQHLSLPLPPLCLYLAERALQHVECAVDLLAGDDEWRLDADNVA